MTIRKPFDGDYRITFNFGEDPEWYTKVFGCPHNGVDFALPVGVPIKAVEDGIVSYADRTPDADGLGVNIIHGSFLSQYWHLSSITARVGQEVKKGDVLGLSGATGFATGPHLHFGIKQLNKLDEGINGWVDPLPLFDKEVSSETVVPVKPKTHKVRRGENLWNIALRYYGEGYKWERIWKSNRDKIKHPWLIYPNQILIIP